MLNDDLRGMWYIMLKDLRAYYLKPPNISSAIRSLDCDTKSRSNLLRLITIRT